MVDFAGWSMPVQYSTIVAEHAAVRGGAGLFDIGHMGRVQFIGPGSVETVEKLVTCRVANLAIGRVRYGLVTNETGGVLDDVLVYRLGTENVGVVVNASNREKVLAWFWKHLPEGVELRDDTFETGMVAFQGAKSAEWLAPHIDTDLTRLKYYQSVRATVDGVPVLASRTGYTGEDGFEFISAAAHTERLWYRLLTLNSQVIPCGLGCRDTLRLEAAMPLYGHELTESIDPLTAGLDRSIDLKKDFTGRDALSAIAATGPTRVRVGLRLAGKRIAREGTPIVAGDAVVGEVTSGTFSPTLQTSIAMGYVAPQYSSAGTAVELDVRGKREAATVVALPFYQRAK